MRSCDLIISGGIVINGLGEPSASADVMIDGERIHAIGDSSSFEAPDTIDATGLVVAPGFIDTHSHDDLAMFRQPGMEFKLTQGVTTVINGNCGLSAAPLQTTNLPPPFPVIGVDESALFASLSEYRSRLADEPASINSAMLVGHTSLRVAAMGNETHRAASPTELESMRSQLGVLLSEGGIGLSSGLAYPGAIAAPDAELEALCEVVSAHDGTYATHMRDEGDHVLDSVNETLGTTSAHQTRLVVSHLKIAGRSNYGNASRVLALLEDAALSSDVGVDVYPYAAGSSQLLASFTSDSDSVLVMWSESRPEFGGQTLDEIQRSTGWSESEAIEKLTPAGAVYFQMDETDVTAFLSSPIAMVGSDGLSGRPNPHPRLWGTFPKVLGHYSRDLGAFPIEEAIRKMTSLPAASFGLAERGRLEAGAFADVVIFDPENVRDNATYLEPETPASGIEHVLVNGAVALRYGSATQTRTGRFLTNG